MSRRDGQKDSLARPLIALALLLIFLVFRAPLMDACFAVSDAFGQHVTDKTVARSKD